MREQILAALSQYGSPALFVVVMVASVGAPLPVTLLLIVTGSLSAQGFVPLPAAIAVAATGSVAGDQIGYAIGRWGGTKLTARFARLLGGPEKLARAEAHARRWGGMGVFLSRWLVSPLGAVVNLVSGTAEYSWGRFLFWDVCGQVFDAMLYIGLGRLFSDRVLALDAALGDFTWAVLALLLSGALGWLLWRSRKNRIKSVT